MKGGNVKTTFKTNNRYDQKLTESEIKQVSKFQQLNTKQLEQLSDFVYQISILIYKASLNEKS